MKYIFVDFDGFQYWIEVDKDGYALRQVTIEGTETLVSCRDDCLAEGVVDTENDCVQISEKDFEQIWSNATEKFRCTWNTKKQSYKVGQSVTGEIKYFYPQGAIVDIGEIQGCGYVKDNKSIQFCGKTISGTISGFDDKNMWILFDKCELY